ncbi:MAG TPA: hypothetical protein VJ731_02330 [Terriglobales bacterium]|nr:hypothetical protein [Terriglobales bacterium]
MRHVLLLSMLLLGATFAVGQNYPSQTESSLIPILWASGIGSDVMKPIAAPMVGGMITSTC